MLHNRTFSADGTSISYRTYGNGPALVILPGALGMAKDFDKFARELSNRFTVHVVDRRGRGESGPQGANYSIEKECEDLRAVCSATDATLLFGHSYGGFIALEASRRDTTIPKIAVYEPGMSIDGSINMDWAAPCQADLDAKRYRDAFITFIRGLNPATARVPRWILRIILWFVMKPDELQQKCVLLSTTIPEHAELARLDNTYSRYGEISAKVLLMVGNAVQKGYPGWPSTKLFPVLRDATYSSFPKLDHLGPVKSPKEVATAVSEFFSS
jgi:pimeloyl-ACP methyl ester carboxylesterase